MEETYDRILSTDVDAVWTWNGTRFANIRDVDYVADTGAFDSVYDVARNTTLRTFALENSASVQATMYNISEEIIKRLLLLIKSTLPCPTSIMWLLTLNGSKILRIRVRMLRSLFLLVILMVSSSLLFADVLPSCNH